MGKLTNFGWSPPHDPTYGISRSNITGHLKRTNWRTKAICRVRDDRCLYILVQRGTVSGDGQKYSRYFVRIHSGSKEGREFERDFKTLKEALAYVNGEDGSKFGQETRPAKASEFPRSQEADTYITGFGRKDGHLQPNFTVTIPGQYTD